MRSSTKTLTLSLILTSSLFAHFQVILPESDTITQEKQSQNIEFMFMHPFEQTYMQMDKPKKASVFHAKKSNDLSLEEKKVGEFSIWSTQYSFKNPGDYIFYVIPEPYFEPSEEKFIQHMTKTFVNAYGLEEGWDEKVGLKAEIIPLTRPYGLWAGNSFSGVVTYKNKPVPNAEIEVEYYNKDSKIKAPSDAHITQVIKADKNGIFTYTMPFAGYWGFAALLEDEQKIKKEGKEYPVELGAVIWIKTYGTK